MTSTALEDFGYAIRQARLGLEWSLEQLAQEALGNGARKGYVGKVEKGQQNLSPETIDKFDQTLDLPDEIVRAVHRSSKNAKANTDNTPQKANDDSGPKTEPETKTASTADDATLKILLEQSERTGAYIKLLEAGITEKAVIEMAQKISADTNDIAQAWVELQNAVEIALRLQSEGTKGSNHGDFVDTVLAQVADLAKDGDYDTASATIDDAVEQADAQLTRLLKRGVEVALLNRDTAKAASLLIRIADLDAGEMATFDTLRALRRHYYETGRDKGSNLNSALAIDLAEQVLNRATTADERGTAQNDLGNALRALGERESGTKRLKQAVAAFKDALKENTQAHVPLQWAMTQNNLGTALKALGERESGTKRLEQAVAAYEEALTEYTQAHVPLQWAMTQMNLGAALRALGERESGTKRLEQAVTAYEEALKEHTQARVPLIWAATQNNLGNALSTLGERESDTERLKQAVTAYKESLKEYTQTRVPLDWAMTQNNLADLEIAFFDKTEDPKHLDQATQYIAAAREVFEAAQASHYVEVADNIIADIQSRTS